MNINLDDFIRVEEGKVLWWQGEEVLVRLVSGMETDITFNALGGSVKAHKEILSKFSSVFRAMFTTEMREGITSIVEVPDISIDGLKLFLLLVYIQGEIFEDGEDEEDIAPAEFQSSIDRHFEELFDACIKYGARCLEPTIIAHIDLHLTVENCHVYWRKSTTMTYSGEGMTKVLNFLRAHNLMGGEMFVEGMDNGQGNLRAYVNQVQEDRGLGPLSNVLEIRRRR